MPLTTQKALKRNPALSLGYTMTAGMLVFAGLGYWIDQKRGSDYFWTVCGMFMGLIYSGYEVWKLVRTPRQEKNK